MSAFVVGVVSGAFALLLGVLIYTTWPSAEDIRLQKIRQVACMRLNPTAADPWQYCFDLARLQREAGL